MKYRAMKASVRLCGSAAALLALCSSAPAAPQQVDLKLVLAVDVSGSIDSEEFQLEREGTADAFADPEVLKAIQGGSLGRIAVAMLDFSSPQFDKVLLDWTVIKDKASAMAFSEAIRNSPRTPGRRTSVSSALELGSLLLESSEKDILATRRVIDVTGDGPNNDGGPMTEAHDKTIAQGVIVNGLPVMDEMANGYFPELDRYYAGCVTGGRGAFVVVVHSYKDYSQAMRHKLILEISQNETLLKQAQETGSRSNLLVRTAAGPQPPSGPTVLRSAPNEFSQHCDIQGGFGGFGFGRF
jgi:Protein of unknown function (DUF1194)